MTSDLIESPEIFIPAEPSYYATWVQTYLRAGGHVDDFRNGLPSDGKALIYATENFSLGNELGSRSKSIIVPEGVTQSGQIGHNSLYFFEGPQTVNVHSVSAWATPEFSEFAELLEPDFKRIVKRAIESAQNYDEEAHDDDGEYDPVESTLEFYGQIAVKLGLDAPSL